MYHAERLKLVIPALPENDERAFELYADIVLIHAEIDKLYRAGHSTPEFWANVELIRADLPEGRLMRTLEKRFRIAVRRYNGAVSKYKKEPSGSGTTGELDKIPEST